MSSGLEAERQGTSRPGHAGLVVKRQGTSRPGQAKTVVTDPIHIQDPWGKNLKTHMLGKTFVFPPDFWFDRSWHPKCALLKTPQRILLFQQASENPHWTYALTLAKPGHKQKRVTGAEWEAALGLLRWPWCAKCTRGWNSPTVAITDRALLTESFQETPGLSSSAGMSLSSCACSCWIQDPGLALRPWAGSISRSAASPVLDTSFFELFLCWSVIVYFLVAFELSN